MPFVPNSFTDGSAGGTPITAATLNNLEQGLVAADITNPASAAGVQAAGYALASNLTALQATLGLYAPAPTGVAATDTANLQTLITQAQATGGTLFLQAGTYVVTNMTTPSSGTQPKIVGKGQNLTFIQGTTTNAALTMTGNQTGSFSGGYLSDLSFKGTGIGLELRGCVGVGWDRIAFLQPLTTGIKFNNFAVGDFTEMCSGQADFEYIPTALEYKVISGNPSFHGSGLTGRSTLNQPASATAPLVLIGAGARPYNAPLTVQVWTFTPAQPVILNNSTQVSNFFGTFSIEMGASAILVDTASVAFLPYVGELVCLGAVGSTLTLGKMQIVERLIVAGVTPAPFSAYDTLAIETAGWTTYTPTLVNATLGNGVLLGRYRVRGKSVEFIAKFTLGTTSTVGTAPQITVPFAQAQNIPVALTGLILDHVNGYVHMMPTLDNGGVTIRAINTAAAYATAATVTATVPFTWSATDFFQVTGSYETV